MGIAMIRLIGLISCLLFSTFVHAELAKDRVFILAGQSNMQGYSATDKVAEELKKQPHNVTFYTRGQKSTIANYKTFGPEIRFTQAIAQTFPHDNVIIIKFVASGSAIKEWQPGSHYYDSLLKQVKLAIDPAKTKIEAFLWMQGETDARNQEDAENYLQRLDTFFSSLRKDLHAEDSLFLVGQINPQDINFPYKKQVQQAQKQYCQEHDNTRLVNTDGVEKSPDKVHYSAKGEIELGKRFAIAYIKKRKEQLLAQMKNSQN